MGTKQMRIDLARLLRAHPRRYRVRYWKARKDGLTVLQAYRFVYHAGR